MTTDMPTNGTDAKAAIARAKREIAEENMKKGVEQLKTKLRDRRTEVDLSRSSRGCGDQIR